MMWTPHLNLTTTSTANGLVDCRLVLSHGVLEHVFVLCKGCERHRVLHSTKVFSANSILYHQINLWVVDLCFPIDNGMSSSFTQAIKPTCPFVFFFGHLGTSNDLSVSLVSSTLMRNNFKNVKQHCPLVRHVKF